MVIELKNDKFRPEYTGKLSFYISAIDGELTTDADNPTIGLFLCKEKNDVVADWLIRFKSYSTTRFTELDSTSF